MGNIIPSPKNTSPNCRGSWPEYGELWLRVLTVACRDPCWRALLLRDRGWGEPGRVRRGQQRDAGERRHLHPLQPWCTGGCGGLSMRSITCTVVWQCRFFLSQSLSGQGRNDRSSPSWSRGRGSPWMLFDLQRRSCFFEPPRRLLYFCGVATEPKWFLGCSLRLQGRAGLSEDKLGRNRLFGCLQVSGCFHPRGWCGCPTRICICTHLRFSTPCGHRPSGHGWYSWRELAASFSAAGSRDSAAHSARAWTRCCLLEFGFKPFSHEMHLLLASSAFCTASV